MANKKQETPNVFIRGRNYFHEIRSETDKVTWPSRDDLKAMTSVVLVFLGILAVIIGSMDIVLQNVVLWMYRSF